MKRILLVEDEEDIRTLLALMLQSAGYEVDTARSITGAQEFIRWRTYDLVMTDWRLDSSGVTGSAVADAAVAKGAKAIIVSGFAAAIPEQERERHQIVAKPIRAAELIDAVERQIGPAGA